MAWLTLLAPIVLELLKLFFAKDTTAEAKEKAKADIIDQLKRINAALKKAEDSDNTQDLEDIINKP